MGVAPVVAYASIRNNVLIENKNYASLSPFPSNSIQFNKQYKCTEISIEHRKNS
jgi:hypothetical protein